LTLKETTAQKKNLEETPQTDPPVVAIAADPTPTPVHHPEGNQYVAPTPAIDPTPTPVHHPEVNPTPAVVATSAPTYPGHAEATAPAAATPAAPASGGISSYLPKHMPTPTHAQMAMAAGAFGAISSASMMAGGAARTHGGTEAASALSGLSRASAYAARATSGITRPGMNANTAAKATATAAKLMELSGLSSLW
jgi:hypothetical protein